MEESIGNRERENEGTTGGVPITFSPEHKKRFEETLGANMKSRNPITRRRAMAAYQRYLEFQDALKNINLYLEGEPESETTETIKNIFEHFQRERTKSFTVFLALKKWVVGTRTPQAYHIHIVRKGKNELVALPELGYCNARAGLD